MLDYIINKLEEPSTWRGLVWIITAFGVVLSPEQTEAIVTFGMTLAGLIAVFIEKGNAHTSEEIVTIVKEEHSKIVEKTVKERKNAKSKNTDVSSDSDNFFND